MFKQINNLIDTIKSCSQSVIEELGTGWKEEIYQKAMEVALRDNGITYETQRVLPITFLNHVIGESIPDLVIWTANGRKRVAVVVDLKAEPTIKGDHAAQVKRYIQELKKQVRSNEAVHNFGLVINFAKTSNNIQNKDVYEEIGDIQIMKVRS